MAMGQGTVIFNNGPSGLVLEGTQPPLPVETGLGRAQLAYAPLGVSWVPCPPYSTTVCLFGRNPEWSLTAPTALFTATGIFSGSVLTLDGIAEGEQVNYVVLAWTGLAPTFDAALVSGGAVGVSAWFTTYTGTASNPVNIADTFGGMIIPLIPEPSAATLALLGAGVLFRVRWSRRR